MRKASAQALLNAYWIPLNFQNSALLTIAVPAVLLRFRGIDHVAVFAMLASVVAVISMIVPPAAGEISDRLHRAGSPRRPVILLGALINAGGLLWMMTASTTPVFTAAVVVATLGQNVSMAAYSALIPEVVPREDWGAASGYQGIGTLVGSIGGLAVAGIAGADHAYATLPIAAGVVLAGALTLFAVPEGPYVEGDRAHVSDWPNFTFAFTSRFWTNFGLTLLNTFILYFFSDVLKVRDASGGTAWVGAMAMFGAILSTIAMGYVSDRLERKVVVAFAGVPMAMAAIGFAVVPDLRWIMLFAILFGLGYGAIVSTGWALAIDSVPKLGNVARDLGVWGIAANLPAIIAPQAGRWLLGTLGGQLAAYRALFVASGACFLLGSVIVLLTRTRTAERFRSMAAALDASIDASTAPVVGQAQLAPRLPWSGGPVLAFAMAVIHPYYLNAYRIRGWGRLPRRRGATLLVSNHQHDLDTTALIMRLSVQGPWMRPIFSVGSRRLFEPGFMDVRLAWLRWLVGLVDWSWMFRMLGVLPIENELRRRSAASLAWAVYARHGDLPASDVFGEGSSPALNGATTLSALARRSVLDKQTYLSLARVREPYRSELVAGARRQIEDDLVRVESVLRAGGTLYLTPEGQYTRDGRIGRFRKALYRLAPLGDIYLLALSYDPFVSSKFSLLYRVVPLPRGAELRPALAAARPIVVSQLMAAWLHGRDGRRSFTREEARAGIAALLSAAPLNAFVDPELAERPLSMIDAALAHMTASGLLACDADGSYRLGSTRKDARFPDVDDIIAHQANHFAETIAGLAASDDATAMRASAWPGLSSPAT